MEENQDTAFDSRIRENMTQSAPLTMPTNSVTQNAAEIDQALKKGSLDGNKNESSAANKSESVSLDVKTENSLPSTTQPLTANDSVSYAQENSSKTSLALTSAPMAIETTVSSLAVDATESLPVKRKSPRADSVTTNDPKSTGKKRKLESNDSTADSLPPKPPIPSFSAPPGQKVVNVTSASSSEIKTTTTTTTTTTTPTKPPLAKSNGISKSDFVTIRVGPIESDSKKTYDKTKGADAANNNAKEETETDASNDSSTSLPVTTTSANKPIQPPITGASNVPEENDTSAEGIVSQYVKLSPLKEMKELRPLRSLSTTERIQLERLFEFDKRKENGKTWDDDWFGVVDLCHTEVQNPDSREGDRHKKRSLLEWVSTNTKTSGGKKKSSKNSNSLKLLNNLLRHVYNYKKVPERAKLILANIDTKDPTSISNAIERLSIDPHVLKEDGWTTTKSKEPQGASGGPYRIGEKIWWQGYLGIVIAFVHDEDMGDLWKALWVEDLATFDLEREELEDARKKYERKKAASTEKKKKQLIHQTLKNDFQVAGIEHGIVLATSYARGARHGVFWPARVLHASELVGNTGRRSKNKKKVDVAFLAPYWNGDQTLATNGTRRIEPFSGAIAMHGESIFSSGPMVEVESIDANETCIMNYPYDAETGLDIDSLRTTFKFLGLPKAAFSRFLDSQRLALGFKTYSQEELKSTLASESDRTSAALLEGHPLAVQAPHFPLSVLQLPFVHILSQLPHHERQLPSQSYSDTAKAEPALRFDKILEAMKPPICWGLEQSLSSKVKETPQFKSVIASPITFLDKSNGSKDDPYNTGRFLVGLLSLQSLLSENSPTSRMLKYSLNELVSTFAKNTSLLDLQKSDSRKRHMKSLNKTWVVVKVSLKGGKTIQKTCE